MMFLLNKLNYLISLVIHDRICSSVIGDSCKYSRVKIISAGTDVVSIVSVTGSLLKASALACAVVL